MLNTLLRRIAASLVGAVLAAVSAGIAAIAAAFALYALLSLSLSPAASAAIDAGVFAVLAALIGLILPQLWKRPKPKVRPGAPAVDPTATRIAADAGLAILGAVAEMARTRRRDVKDTKETARGRPKRRQT
jgi:hypothetical protein